MSICLECSADFGQELPNFQQQMIQVRLNQKGKLSGLDTRDSENKSCRQQSVAQTFLKTQQHSMVHRTMLCRKTQSTMTTI
jgi:hypothetical protein